MPISTAIVSAAAVALHQIKRREGSGISGSFATFERAITDKSFIADLFHGVATPRYFDRRSGSPGDVGGDGRRKMAAVAAPLA